MFTIANIRVYFLTFVRYNEQDRFTYMKQNEFLKKFGHYVKELRLEKNLSISEMANICAMEEKYIIDLENGEVDCPIDFLIQLADALDVKLHELFSFN